MDDQTIPALAQSSAVRAFEDLRAEVSLLRRALEGLTAERQAQPDYTPTLAEIDRRLQGIFDWARKISEKPAIKLSPDALSNEIEKASIKVRRTDAEALAQARAAFEAATLRLEAALARSRSAAAQRKWLIVTGISFLILGVLLGALSF